MANDKIDAILAKKKTEAAPGEGGKFFSIPALGDTEEKFLELQFKNGVNTCFSFSLLTWFGPGRAVSRSFRARKHWRR